MAVTEPVFMTLLLVPQVFFFFKKSIPKFLKILQTVYSLMLGDKQAEVRTCWSHRKRSLFNSLTPVNERGLPDDLRPQLLLLAKSTLIQPLNERGDPSGHT
jgi:hypothetical protein